MTRSRRPSPQTLTVLDVLAQQPESWLHGLEIATGSGLKSGSLYPILIRLAERGWLESEWREPEKQGRPPRHVYRITGLGRAGLRAARAPTPSTILGSSFA